MLFTKASNNAIALNPRALAVVAAIMLLLPLLQSCDAPSSEQATTSGATEKKTKRARKSHASENDGSTNSGTSAKSKRDRRYDDVLLDIPVRTVEETMQRYLPQAGTQKIGPKELIKAAEQAIHDKDYEAAQVIAERLVQMSPQSVQGYSLRGRARSLSLRGGDEEAIKDLEKAIKMGTEGSGRPYEALARLYDSKGKVDQAIDYLGQAIKVEPDEHDYYKFRAALHAGRGNNALARADYDKAISVNPNNAASYFQRGKFLESIKSYDEAISDYAHVVEAEKRVGKAERTAVARKFRANLLSLQGKHKEAVAELTKMLESEANDDEFLRLRGQEYAKLKMYKEAERDLSRSIENSLGFSPDVYESRAAIYELQGKTDKAANDRKLAKEIRDKPAESPLYTQ